MFLAVLAQTATNDLAEQANGTWEQVITFATERGADLGVNMLAALAIFIIGRWVAKAMRRLSGRLMAGASVDQTLAKFLTNIIYTLLLAFVIVAAVDRLGVDTTYFAAIIAAVGFAIGLALQGSLANFAAGVMLILFKPFKVGDSVEAGGSAGVIEEIHIFSTFIRTEKNVQIIIPNNQITGKTITNYSA